MKELCPCCGEGFLTPTTEINIHVLAGKEFDVLSHYSICDTCGSDVTTPKQAKKNKRIYLETIDKK